jgi:phosphatidylglycerol lysyltransferase
MLRKASVFLYAFLLAVVVAWKTVEIQASYRSEGKVVPVQLTRGVFNLLEFPSNLPTTRAIILFGSGDGGWSGLEEVISQAFQDSGYEIVGIDSCAYAKTDYNMAILQADYGSIAAKVEAPYGRHPPPLIIGGWSMGAEQAAAVGGGPNPPRGLSGLLLLDPLDRGRYGLRFSDQIDLLPTGPGTFSMEQFDTTMGNLRVAQWHAAQDPIDSRRWLQNLKAPHKEFDFGKTGHYYNNDRREFLIQLIGSVPWILSLDHNAVSATGSNP